MILGRGWQAFLIELEASASDKQDSKEASVSAKRLRF